MIRRATIDDIDAIMDIVHDAQLALRELGIDQWQDGYPSREVVADDISKGVGYVKCRDGRIVGYTAMILDGEAAYHQIAPEKWNTPESYVVVHRLCVARVARRCGVAIELMRHAADYARNEGITAFRVDTHRGNVRMLAMLDRLCFNYVGTIHYDSGERLAYDLDLSLSDTL